MGDRQLFEAFESLKLNSGDPYVLAATIAEEKAAVLKEKTRLRNLIAEGNTAEVQRMLQHSPDLASPTSDDIHLGGPPLNLAAALGHVHIAQLLLLAGASFDHREHCHVGRGKSPLLAAAERGQVDMARFLLSLGAPSNDWAGARAFPLEETQAGAPIYEIERRLKSGQYNGENGEWNDCWTAVHHSASLNNPALCATLLMCGADPSVPSRWSLTAADVAPPSSVVKAMLAFAESPAGGMECPYDVERELLAAAPEEFRQRVQAALLAFKHAMEGMGLPGFDEATKQRIVGSQLGAWLCEKRQHMGVVLNGGQ